MSAGTVTEAERDKARELIADEDKLCDMVAAMNAMTFSPGLVNNDEFVDDVAKAAKIFYS